MNGDSN